MRRGTYTFGGNGLDTSLNERGHFSWPSCLPPLQSYSHHVLHLRSLYHHFISLCKSCRNIMRPVALLYGKSSFHEVDIKALLALKCSIMQFNVIPSTPNAGLEVLVGRSISKGKATGSYYGPLVFTDLSRQKQ